MMMDTVMQRFVEHTPITVMARLTLQRALEPAWIDMLFEQHRQTQYTRELLFSITVEVMSVVAVGLQPSVHAAAKACKDLPVSYRRCTTRSSGPNLTSCARLCRGQRRAA